MTRLSLVEFSRLFLSGVLDSICLRPALYRLYRQSQLRWLYYQVLFLNGLLSIGSILFFERILHPLFSDHAQVGSFLPSLLYYMLWVWPLFLLAYLLNSIYYAQMSAALHLPDEKKEASFGHLSLRISSFLYQLSILFFSFHLYTLLYYLPWLGPPLSFIGLSSLVSYSAYTCSRAQIESQLYTEIECHWPYYTGFGALLAGLSYMPGVSVVMSASVYSLLFPMLLILAAVQKKPDFQHVHRSVTLQDGDMTRPFWHVPVLPRRLPLFVIGKYITHLFIRKLRNKIKT